MAEIDVRCPHCGEEAKAPAEMTGQIAECPSCGKKFNIPSPGRIGPPCVPERTGTTPVPVTRRPQPIAKKNEVVVTDIRIPFGSMVEFMIKLAIASIPAFIIYAILVFIASAIFMGGCASLLLGAN